MMTHISIKDLEDDLYVVPIDRLCLAKINNVFSYYLIGEKKSTVISEEEYENILIRLGFTI